VKTLVVTEGEQLEGVGAVFAPASWIVRAWRWLCGRGRPARLGVVHAIERITEEGVWLTCEARWVPGTQATARYVPPKLKAWAEPVSCQACLRIIG